MAARKKQQRPARRERAIFRATLEELAHADYGALSMERVAARARVNKTTLYRRWPTKTALVHAALNSIADALDVGVSTGSLREDLLSLGRKMLAIALSVEAQGLLRLRLLDHPEPELAQIAASLQARRQEQLGRLLGAAVARGEVRPNADLGLVVDLLVGMIHVRLFVKNARVDDLVLTRAVETLVSGISAPKAAQATAARGQKRKSRPVR
ncbi:MAG TPA: TetR/AcrR family transcriptional regulator C-terminal ligand-binding domain-containing protein [Polyangiaceae bacterium]|jgi:AcrR family transcriptional regulator